MSRKNCLLSFGVEVVTRPVADPPPGPAAEGRHLKNRGRLGNRKKLGMGQVFPV